MSGIANTDPDNGIRFGFINQNSCDSEASQCVFDDGTDVSFENYKDEARKALRSALSDFFSDYKSGNEPKSTLDEQVDAAFEAIEDQLNNDYQGDSNNYEYEKDDYKIQTAFDGVCFAVVRSPFYTLAPKCSPCAPNGGDLDNANKLSLSNEKTYCLGHDWFENDVAPYPVFRVKDDVQIVATLRQVPCPFCTDGRRPMTTIAEARGITLTALTCQVVDKTFEPRHMLDDFNLKDMTVTCLHCSGSGTRSETVESEVQP